MSTVKNYLSLVKFSHTIFAMPFAMIGFAIGVNAIDIHQYTFAQILLKFLLVLVCMVTARSAAMAFNRYLDRSFDAKNPRTAIREIPRGIISPNNALRFTIINCILFIIATFFINKLCFALSFVALFVVLFYSYTKRFTALCHLVLGLGMSLAPIGAYIAVTGKFDLLPVLFSIAVITWGSGFDIIYAMQDIDFDNSQKLHSIPTFMGAAKALNLSVFLHIISAAAVVFAGVYGHFGILYWLGIAVFIGMLVYQHLLVKPNDLSKVNIAFMTANGIASIVFGVLVIADVIVF
ncbi:4-hydroxybenzoate octaprenyltransferase [Arachidicoccus ginsenosidimutans]|uniref:UbiA-like polyprenyltransferase n=1 Tax=Arachidicoccus sp. BS20 TaxID=1850526 RepID=UPI0007F0E530|nr:UbiA-like polyprenyltransferase [Arachidicoccus sp. BS20]ANI90511.1 4-hydroxybenzoate octaprenyltransferase [Arachidicoccus sp. BS20]